MLDLTQQLMFEDELKTRIAELLKLKKSDNSFLSWAYVSGYTESEINLYENIFGFELPKLYKEFLSVIGKPDPRASFEYSLILRGSISLESLINAKKDVFDPAYPIREDMSAFADKNLVFYLIDDATDFEFFVVGNDDPKTYLYNRTNGVTDFGMTLSERILYKLENSIKINKSKPEI
jgi:hypothetical protein